jgi:hypothetical protein
MILSTMGTRIWVCVVAAALLALATPARAQDAGGPISISFVAPAPHSPVQDALGVTVQITSTYEPVSVKATVPGDATDLVRSGSNWGGTLSLAGLPWGTTIVSVTVVDVFGNTASATTDVVHNHPPTLTVHSPEGDYGVAHPNLHLSADCADDAPDPCVVTASLVLDPTFPYQPPGRWLGSAPSHLELDVSLAGEQITRQAIFSKPPTRRESPPPTSVGRS